MKVYMINLESLPDREPPKKPEKGPLVVPIIKIIPPKK
jgi:hypothetical protein